MNLFASRSRFADENDTRVWGSSVIFDYRKTNPWGELLAVYSVTPTFEKSAGGIDAGVVLDERHFYDINNPGLIILHKRNIDLSTIRVTDGTGLTVYAEDRDYKVLVFDGLVHIDVIPFSPVPPSIDQSQDLLFSYQFLTDAKREEDSLTQNIRIRQNFDNNFSVYYHHIRRDEEIRSFGGAAITPNEYSTNTFGAAYNYNELYLTAEYSRTDSTQTSSANTALRGNYSVKLTRDATLTAHASHSWNDFSGTRTRKARILNTGGAVMSQITDQLDFFTSVDWRDETDSDIGDTQGFRFRTELNYKFRLLTIITGVEYYSLDRLSTENESSNFYIKLVRCF